MNVGAIGLVALGGLLIHAALTDQSPLTDLRGIFQTGTATPVIGGVVGQVGPGQVLSGPQGQNIAADTGMAGLLGAVNALGPKQTPPSAATNKTLGSNLSNTLSQVHQHG